MRFPGPPPGPFQRTSWDSPIRGPWLTATLGILLLIATSLVALTGFLSHAAYEPELGRNALVARDLPLTFGWPTSPAWLYALTQGIHVNVGLATIPLLLAKLWSVMPKLFVWPPAASPAQAIERAAIALLVSSMVFQLATGVCNSQNWYPFGFNFVTAHYYGAVVFVASLSVHVAVKTPTILRAYRGRGVLVPLRDDLAHTRPEPWEPDGLVADTPAAPTISRRGLLALTGAGAGLVLLAGAGQAIGGPLRRLSFLAPRARGTGEGPNEFPVNKTFRGTRVPMAAVGAAYRLRLSAGRGEVALTRDELLALPQHTAELPIACVEGWSTTQTWTGVRLAELARLAGAPDGAGVLVESLQPRGSFRRATLSGDQVAAADALLALRVNGVDLSLDHGYPARVIVPALPGVHCTKWVSTLTFGGVASA